MKLVWENGQLFVKPTEEEIAKRKKQAFLESGHETIEKILQVLRGRGIEVPQTAYEKVASNLTNRFGKVT